MNLRSLSLGDKECILTQWCSKDIEATKHTPVRLKVLSLPVSPGKVAKSEAPNPKVNSSVPRIQFEMH